MMTEQTAVLMNERRECGSVANFTSSALLKEGREAGREGGRERERDGGGGGLHLEPLRRFTLLFFSVRFVNIIRLSSPASSLLFHSLAHLFFMASKQSTYIVYHQKSSLY